MDSRARWRVTNAEISRLLRERADLLVREAGSPHKIRAYRRAAGLVARLPSSLDREARAGADLTRYRGIGKSIAALVREVVFQRSGQLELPLAQTRDIASSEGTGRLPG